jgi:hypothetical protein
MGFSSENAVNYCRTISLLLTLISFWALTSDAASVTMNKCTYSDGRVEFTDQPCSSDALPLHDENKIPPQPIQQNSLSASKLKGTWVIDPKATENFVLSATLPANASKLAEWFGLAGGYWALFTYEFDGDSATMSAYRGARKLEFQLLSQQGAEIKYTPKNDTSSPAKTLSVFLLKDGNIKIVPSESPESSYVLWKRGALKTEQATPDYVMAASRTWLASLQNIVKFLRETPEKTLQHPIPIAKEDPHPALEAAIRNGSIRRATPADAQAWLDADVEKYRRKNISPLDNSHESSILSAEISKGSAYVVLKKYTYPPGLENNNKAIFLIPRNIPVPDGDYGDSKIYHFYEKYFTGTSVEFSAGSPW